MACDPAPSKIDSYTEETGHPLAVPTTALLQGCILFLRAPSEIKQSELKEYLRGSSLWWKGDHHPVMIVGRVVSKEWPDDCVSVCPIVFFRGRPITEVDLSEADRQNYYPIRPSAPFPNRPQLQDESQLWEQGGYISLKNVYQLHSKLLRVFDRTTSPTHFRLTKESFKEIAPRLQVEVTDWPSGGLLNSAGSPIPL